MSAGWGTGNAYGILGEDDETGEGAIRVPAPVKAAAPVATKSNKEESKAVQKNSVVVDNKESNRKQDGARERRPPRTREDRSEEGGQHRQQQQQQQQQVSNNNSGSAGAEPQPEGGFNRTRGTSERTGGERRERRPNPDNVGNPSGQRAPRTYDRQSGTGRGREQKRHGAGRGNWGSNEEEIALEQQAPATVDNWATSEGNVSSWGDGTDTTANEQTPSSEPAAAPEPAPPRELTEEEKARQAEREAEAKLMTLDEYLKNKKSLTYKLPEARKAGEGEDDSQWANFVAAKSDKAASEEAAGKKLAEEKKEKAAKKVPLPAELLRFKGEQQRRDSERRERGPRDSDRGSDRGFQRRDGDAPRPRPQPRQQQQQQHGAGKSQVDFAATDFPALKQ